METGEPVIDIDIHGTTLAAPEVERDWVCSYFPFKLHGMVGGVIAMVREVTEQKRAEAALKESEKRYQDLYDDAPDLFVSVDAKAKRILQCNRTLATTLGYTKEEIVGQPLSLVYHPDCMDDVKIAFRSVVETGEVHDAELQLKTKDESKIDVSLNVSVVRDDQGNVLYSRSTLRDISARKRAELEIRRMNEDLKQRTAELQAANSELEAFTYSVSHDLRAPLRAMQGFADALLEGYRDHLDATGQQYARRIVASAENMEVLIQDLLEYGRLSRADLHVRAVPLDSVLADALEHVQAEVLESGAQVDLEKRLPRVRGHHATLVRMVENLLSNAVKFVAPGVKPRVRVWAEPRGRWIRLWVEDNGLGIATDHHERIFRVFERLHGIETYPGTGIGLAIVRKGADRLGGRVGVESAPGEGSKFWLDVRKEDGER
jgi:PAS domain S-box-containing protein